MGVFWGWGLELLGKGPATATSEPPILTVSFPKGVISLLPPR